MAMVWQSCMCTRAAYGATQLLCGETQAYADQELLRTAETGLAGVAGVVAARSRSTKLMSLKCRQAYKLKTL